MDPILATIIGGVLWFFLGSVASVLVYLIFAVGLAFVLEQVREGLAPLGFFFGWLFAAAFEVFVLVQVIVHVVRLVQLLSGQAVTV